MKISLIDFIIISVGIYIEAFILGILIVVEACKDRKNKLKFPFRYIALFSYLNIILIFRISRVLKGKMKR